MSIIDALISHDLDQALLFIREKHESIHEVRDGATALDIATMMQETDKKNEKLQEIVDLLEEEYEDDDYEDSEDISSIGSDGYDPNDDYIKVAPGANILDEDDIIMHDNLSAALDKKGGKKKCITCKNKKHKKRKSSNKRTKKSKKRKSFKKSKQSKSKRKYKSKSKKLHGG